MARARPKSKNTRRSKATGSTQVAEKPKRSKRLSEPAPPLAPEVTPVDGDGAPIELPAFPVVGIGASAGGLEACTQLLRDLPRDPGAAIFLVQHLAPQHESFLPDLLADQAKLPVLQGEDGQPIEPNCVYVIPPNTQMSIMAGKVHLMPRPEDRTQYRPIDFFFRSLAAYGQTKAIGIVLSGSDSDGAIGLREIKAGGGITIAQEPKTAKFEGMPRAAMATGIVDLVLSPAEIAAELVRIARHPLTQHQDALSDGRISVEQNMAKVFSLLRSATGVDFALYKLPTIRRRMQRRMILHKISNLEDYVKLLQKDPQEVRSLYQDILIHVTRFFRDSDSFATLASRVFPHIMAHRPPEQPIRIWVPGCSTGEEPYSVAIALLEFLGDQSAGIPVQIFATDVSDSAIEHARAGVFPPAISTDVSLERLRRFFTKSDGSYRISKQVRDICIFARQDLTRDPPFSKLDLVMCRNVLIYLGPVLQRKLINIFHYALKPHGFLMLGSAETTGSSAELFTVLDKRHRLYGRKSAARADLELPHSERIAAIVAHRHSIPESRGAGAVQNEASRVILSRYSPPGVVVDSDLQIIQFRGQTGMFLQPAPGDASFNLLKMAREGLLYGLRTALHEARKSDKPVRKEGLRLKVDGNARVVNLEAIPLAASQGARHFLILFEDVTSQDGKKNRAREVVQPKVTRKERDVQLHRLQEELAANRDYLQSMIQDLEATNEELQSANEEILSANEELQSTNEELDTAKEELQSTNEELNTVNDELLARNDELARANSDLLNLLGSVQIAIVMVASDLRIRKYTPMAEKVLNLIPSDIGRPISDIKPNIDVPDLEEMIHEAIESVGTRERAVQDRHGTWYSLRIRPYKNGENRIDGAVLALFDIDAMRRKEAEVRDAREYAELLIDIVREPLMILDGDLRVQQANGAYYQAFKTAPPQTLDHLLAKVGNGQWNVPELLSALKETLHNGDVLEHFKVDREFETIGRRSLLLNARAIPLDDRPSMMLVLAIEDVTDRNTGVAGGNKGFPR